MALRTLLVVAQLERADGLPENRLNNDWHFQWDDAEDPAVDTYQEASDLIASAWLGPFYLALDGVIFSPLLASVGHTIKVYDLADPQPRTPRATSDLPDLTLSGDSMPGEVALCMSFKSAIPSGVVASRYRNRVYLGPIKQQAGMEATGEFRPTSTAMNAVVNAGDAMFDTNNAVISWVLYSPTDAAVRGIDTVWCDNAFDTQRRRGAAPTSRVSEDVTL